MMNKPVVVQASDEFLEQSRDQWSPPVSVLLHWDEANGWEMTFRTHECGAIGDPEQ